MRFLYVHRDDIRRWQLATLEIQQHLQDILLNAGIKTWCGGGTLIGAVRERGFLYWDTDLDMFFDYRDYKKILQVLVSEKFFEDHAIFYHRDEYWQENMRFEKLVKTNKHSGPLFDFEVAELAKGMFKVFSRNGVDVKFYDSDFGKPEEFVKILHFAKIHMTRHRLAYRDDTVEFDTTYKALPNVCMLPMIRMNLSEYFVSTVMFLIRRTLGQISFALNFLENKLERKNSFSNTGSADPRNQNLGFDIVPRDRMTVKLKLIPQNLIKFVRYVFYARKRIKEENLSGETVAYKDNFFRFLVLPYLVEDIFPLRKMAFEGTSILVPNNPDAVLSIQFGDYLQVPSVNNRLAYPFFIHGRID